MLVICWSLRYQVLAGTRYIICYVENELGTLRIPAWPIGEGSTWGRQTRWQPADLDYFDKSHLGTAFIFRHRLHEVRDLHAP